MPQGLFAAAAQKFPPPRCWNHTPEPRAATGLPHPAAGSILQTRGRLQVLTPTLPLRLWGQRNGQKRVSHCPGTSARVSSSQVPGIFVAGGGPYRRRSVFLASPATHIGLRSKRTSQVRRFFADLRHFDIRPAALRSGTCDVFGPVTFATRLQKPSSTFASEKHTRYGNTSSYRPRM